MEEVPDESRIYDHQNDTSDKMNGSASRETDGSDNAESTSLGDDISKLKTKLSDLQSLAGDQEPTNPTNESSTEVEHSSLRDNSAKEASPRSMDPSSMDAAKDSKNLGTVAPSIGSNEIPGSPISEGDFEELEDELEQPVDESEKPIDKPEKPVDELEQPIDESPQPVDESEQPIDGSEQSIGESELPLDESDQHISKPDQNATVDATNEVSTSQDGAQKDTSSESMEIEPPLKDSNPDPSEPQEEDDETQNSNPIDVNSPTSVSMVDETSVNAESANPESPAENAENDPLSKDGEVQDSGGNDVECSKSIPEDSEDKSMDHNDIDNHSDISSRIDGNSCEPTEKTRFLSMDQDSVPDDVDMETRGSPENVEDPFSTGPEEASEVVKPAEKLEEVSVAQETIEESEAPSRTKEVEEPKESSEGDKTSKEVAESSEVLKAAEKLSEIRESAEESSDRGKAVEEKNESLEVEAMKESEETSVTKESVEKPEESSKAEKTSEELKEPSENLETTKEPEESSEIKESVEAPEEASEAGKTTGVESSVVPETVKNPEEIDEIKETEESSEITKTTVVAKESSEQEETTKKPEKSSGEKVAVEEPEKSTEAKETAEGAEPVQKSTDKVVNEDLSTGDAVSVDTKTAEAEKESTGVTKPQDELLDAPESPSLLIVDEPELMEIDDTPETSATETRTKEAEKELAAAVRSIDGSKKTSKQAERDPEAEEVIIDDDDEKVVQKRVVPTKTPKAVSRGRKKSSVATGSETENICIVPDLPEIETVTSLAPLMEKETPSPVTPSGRTQRRAAKTAGIKMKKMMASMSDATDDSVSGKNAIQSTEKAVSSANFVRKCAECKKRLIMSESCLFWETMEFCNEVCLGSYLTKLGEFCANCKGSVQPASLGKYCVRFGTDINQFCCSQCLEEFKKGLKVCSYCQKDISSGPEGFLAPVGDKGQFKDFCSQECMVLYEAISNNVPEPTERHACAVCKKDEIVNVKVRLKGKETKLCNDICFAAFKFANSIECEKCNMCRKYYHDGSNYVIYYEDELHTFCSKTCMNVYILGKRRIILCNTCKVKKYNFDMIKRVLNNGTTVMACSLNCLALYQIQKNSSSVRAANACENCGLSKGVQYYLNMSDGTARNFCSLVCTMNFQTQCKLAVHSNVYPTSGPKRVSAHKKVTATTESSLPVISTVTSLAQANGPKSSTKSNSHPPSKTGVIQQIVMRPPIPKSVHNKIIQCRPAHNTKGVSCKPFMTTKSTQTEEEKQTLIPIPVPIYVPLPCSMYKLPVPFAVPIPLPIPVPIFIPTTRNSAKGIMKQIKKIQKKIPQDPFEAELLMMAEMVAEDKKTDETTSSEDDDDDDDDDNDNDNVGDTSVAGASLHNESEDDARAPSSSGNQSPAVSTRSSISCKAPHLDDLADIEDTLKPATIVPTERPSSEQSHDIEPPSPPIQKKARKRTSNSSTAAENLGVKRVRRSQEMQETSPMAPSPPLEIIRPDANMNLKYTYGVNAWRQWVIMKNMETEKTAKTGRKSTPFKTDLLKLTPDELSFTLCLFLKEVKKPNGTEYAPDTLYYFCLGIQHYLYENGRVDNLFTDPFYEPFTDRLDEVGIKFSSMYDGTRQIVTRIEEEHLWESKQLGAHSPHVLLNTLMFFNTKHFNLATVDEHMQLSFAHIMKHWKRNSGGAAIPASSKHQPPGNRNVLLRFYPPQSALEGNSRKKKMYEQRENEENPLRCPVKLYEFYLSKCPESVKTRNDVFYLLPERSCVPDSPVWYSTMALDKKSLMKSLNRIKMVKEVNIALLTL